MKLITRLSALAVLALAPIAAFAARGYVTDDVSMRAGPDTDFPRILVLEEGTPVHVFGCIDGWEWCDVSADGERGWVAGRFVDVDYGGRRVVLYDYGPRLGVPIVSFTLGSYWGSHYRHHAFYDRRDYWSRHWGGGSRYSYNGGSRDYGRRGYNGTYDGRTHGRTYDRTYGRSTTTYNPTYRDRTYANRRYAQQSAQAVQQQQVIQQQQAQIRAQQFQQQRIQRQQVQQQQAQIQQQAQQQQQARIQQQAAAQAQANRQYAEQHGDNGRHRGQQMAHQDRGRHRGRDKDEKQR